MNRAIARVRGATAAYSGVSGYVMFEQLASDPLATVTVHVQITGLTPGNHGFHVHQYGDVRYTDGLQTMGAHFVPFCVPPDMEVDANGNLIPSDNTCSQDARHGIPPDVNRQPGDMGNIAIQADGTPDVASSLLTIGQQKMSLSDGLRSIIGRTVVVHMGEDDGGQPFGNAGVPEAYGVIGIKSTDAGLTNEARAPSRPHVDKIMCTFEPPAGDAVDGIGASAAYISGFALLSLQEPYSAGKARLQAELAGLTAGSTHSFHFHKWGDMTVDLNDGRLGEIYSSNSIELDELHVDSRGIGLLDTVFDDPSLIFDTSTGLGGLQQHVGRSLTIHSGPSTSSPTIAAAACGIAHPHAALDTDGQHSPAGLTAGLSGGVVFLVVVTAIFIVTLGCIATLYYFRYPIPLCGRWLYSAEYSTPPPPPPDKTVPMVQVNKV